MRIVLKLLVPVLALPVSGCLSAGFGGGTLSPPTEGVAALDGGLIGQDPVGRTLPDDARARALEAEFQALNFATAGQPVAWNADGYSGEVVPTQLYRVGSQDCRGYSHVFQGESPAVKAVGTACRTASGFWKPVV